MCKFYQNIINNYKKFITGESAAFIRWLLFFFGIFLIFVPILFTRSNWLGLDFSFTGQVGDTIGGITAPFLSFIGILITFFAFWVQFKANNQQKLDLVIERFESKFYNLIEIHRNNVSEISIRDSIHGRKAFVSMFNELKFIYLIIKDYYLNNYKYQLPKEEISEDMIYNISYLIFFFGIGPNSSLIVTDLIDEKYHGFFYNVEEILKRNQASYRSARKHGGKISANTNDGFFELDIPYVPCQGHMSRLSHYIRHLFQLVKFVDDADSVIFDYEKKYNYVASIRAQLSTHEQLLLFYNAVSAMGQPWLDIKIHEKENYLSKYCIVKSLPLPLANFYKDPLLLLGKKNKQNKPMFEWIEIKSRL